MLDDEDRSAGTLSVVIAGRAFGYPEGSGAAARTRAYAKGLMENGARVHVVSLLPPARSAGRINSAASGVDDGVSYEYACGTRTRPSSFLGRRLLDLRIPLGLWRAARRHFAGAPGPRAVIAYSDQPTWIILTALVARSLGARCVLEVCEIPLVSERDPFRLAVRRWLLDHVAYHFIDGFIAISAYLEDYLRRRAPDKPVIRVPILVAPEEFFSSDVGRGDGSPARLVFVGGLEERETADLLRAFSTVARHHPDVLLEIVGGGNAQVTADLAQLVEELGLSDRVRFAGWATRDQLPSVLANATALLLPRRDEAFSRAGFPNKLGEYLASGRPVVSTVTGEIGHHLTDKETAYLVPPGDHAAFAAAVGYVLDHGQEAAAVGVAGRELAAQRFDHRRHGRRLRDFLEEL